MPSEEFALLSKEWQVLCVPVLVCLPGLRLPASRGMNLAQASLLTNAILSLNVLFALMGRGTSYFTEHPGPDDAMNHTQRNIPSLLISIISPSELTHSSGGNERNKSVDKGARDYLIPETANPEHQTSHFTSINFSLFLNKWENWDGNSTVML